MQSRKTLLFQNGEPWMKKSCDQDFDDPMGCFDGAEVCDTTGLFLLHRLSHIVKKSDIGLYRDDGLGIIQNMPKPEIERMKNTMVKVCKECGLSIIIECNLKTVNFLDVTFYLINGIYKPYREANDNSSYIHKNSCHNRATLHPATTLYGCNCRVKDSCPLNGECLTPKLVYRADIENNSNNEKKYYLGLSETTFKERYRNHKKESNNSKYQNSTELSKYIWKLNRGKTGFTIKWSIVERVNGNANSTRCNLCLTEKLWIINSINDENCLNKKLELISKCRHLNKVLLKSVKKT